MTITIVPSTSSTMPTSPAKPIGRRQSGKVPQRSNSSGDLKHSARNGRRQSSGSVPSTIGSTMKKAKASPSSRATAATSGNNKKGEKKTKASKAGFEAWAAARLTTSPTPSSAKASASSPVFMPTVVAPVWQPSESILSLVHQADESPRLPPAVTVSAPSSPVFVPRTVCPSLEPLSTTATPPCSPREEVVAVAPEPVAVHDDFEIETTRIVSCVVPTMMAVVPQQVDVHTSEPVSLPIMEAASYMSRTPAIRTLIMVLVALAALGAVLMTSSANQIGMHMSMGAALPSVMLLAAFINRSSSSPSPSLLDDDCDTTNDTTKSTSTSTSTLNNKTTAAPTRSSPPSSPHQGSRRASRRRTAAQ